MQTPRLLDEAPHWMTLETTMSYREVIVGGAIVGFFVVLSMAAEPWLGSDQSSVTDVIQLALTPAFLLTAVAALLNVFSTRLGRVADRVDLLSAELQRGAADTEFLSAQLDFLRTRSLILDVAVVLATVGGAATASIRSARQPSTPIRVRICLNASGLPLAVGPVVFGLRPIWLPPNPLRLLLHGEMEKGSRSKIRSWIDRPV